MNVEDKALSCAGQGGAQGVGGQEGGRLQGAEGQEQEPGGEVRNEVGCCTAAGQGGGATVPRWRSCSARWKMILASVDKSSIEEEEKEREKKAEAEKEAKAKLLTQSSITELYIVQVKKKLESAKEAFENAD